MAQEKKVGVVGAGNMGSGIVQKLAQEGFTVVMHDMKPEFVANGKQRIETLLGEAVERNIFRPEQVEAILGRIQGTTDLADLADCDTVIEAVFEDLDVKKSLFAELDRVCDPDTILDSNTSSFYVADLAEAEAEAAADGRELPPEYYEELEETKHKRPRDKEICVATFVMRHDLVERLEYSSVAGRIVSKMERCYDVIDDCLTLM